MTIYRQGDVVLQKIDNLPKDAEKQTVKGRIVLAYGEATGHAHAISAGMADLYEWQGNRLIQVGKRGAALVHEEHTAITLAPGTYKVIRQREYIASGIRHVAD